MEEQIPLGVQLFIEGLKEKLDDMKETDRLSQLITIYLLDKFQLAEDSFDIDELEEKLEKQYPKKQVCLAIKKRGKKLSFRVVSDKNDAMDFESESEEKLN